MTEHATPDVRVAVRDRYGEIARQTSDGCCAPPSAEWSACCSPSEPESGSAGSCTTDLGYSTSELESLPEGADLGLGCGNPGALAELEEGQTVLDLGAGGGIDCFLAARRVGDSGHVIGVDMTPDMLERARANVTKLGVTGVEFRLGEIENLPVADRSVDVVLSNCVVNLSPDKPRVFREALRVLKPGGRIAIADMVAPRKLPESVRNDPASYAGCIGGAVTPGEIETMLEDAGFDEIRVRYRGDAPDGDQLVRSATIEARRPSGR